MSELIISLLLCLNTLAFIISLRKDILKLNGFSDLSILLGFIWILETVLSKYFGLFYTNNIILYNLLSHSVIVLYFLIFRDFKNQTNYLLVLWIIISIVINIDSDWNILFIRSYLIGLIISSVFILMYFKRKILHSEDSLVFKDYKLYLGGGILIFLSCSFPMLYFWHSHTVSGGDKGLFMILLQVGNVFLSLGYLIASIVHYKWTPQQK